LNNPNRVNDAATVVLNGGTLNYLGGSGDASTETLGTVFFNSGHSTIQTTAGSGAGSSVALTAGGVGRNPGATANLVAGAGQVLGSATTQLLVNVAASALLTNGIIKGFTVTDGAAGGFNLATATGNTAPSTISALTTYQTLSTTTNGNSASDNV